MRNNATRFDPPYPVVCRSLLSRRNRKSQLEFGPTALFDDPDIVSRELEEHLDFEGRYLDAAGAADREMSVPAVHRSPQSHSVAKRGQQVVELTTRIDIDLSTAGKNSVCHCTERLPVSMLLRSAQNDSFDVKRRHPSTTYECRRYWWPPFYCSAESHSDKPKNPEPRVHMCMPPSNGIVAPVM